MSGILAFLVGGWKRWAWGIGMALLAAAVMLLRKSGADAEKLKMVKADAKAAETIGKERAKAQSASDEELDRKVDRWTRN